MKYMGSKSKVAKFIVPILQKYIDENNITTYIEPFCGGCNIIDKINCKEKIASDKHKYLIAILQNLDKLYSLPEFISKEHYSEVRKCFNQNLNRFEDWYIGSVGFLASYNGRFFDGGYAGLVKTKDGNTRNYYDEAKRNLLEQIHNLKDIQFNCCDFTDYKDIKNAIFYCDIPYKNTKQYDISKNFDYPQFWQWAEYISQNNIVIVSERIAQKNWRCLWEQPIKRTIDNTKRVDSIERLFIIK